MMGMISWLRGWASWGGLVGDSSVYWACGDGGDKLFDRGDSVSFLLFFSFFGGHWCAVRFCGL